MKKIFFEESEDFLPLPTASNHKNEKRLTGFEFEYTNISIPKCAELVANHFDGELEKESPFMFTIQSTPIGRIKIFIDWKLGRKIAQKDWKELPAPLTQYLKKQTRKLSDTSTFFVPWELVTDPVSEEQLHHLESLRLLLCENQAQGASSSIAYAFGTHINCQIPNEEVETILSYLRAFFILYPTLLEKLSVHPSRRILSFVAPFPKDYMKIILDMDYSPSWEQFIDDYLRFNHTRNRALDLMPLFCFLFPETKEKIKQSMRDLVKERPTFHYRLPNCDIGDPNWRVAHAWNSWIAVERLAEDRESLVELCQKFHFKLTHPWRYWLSNLLKK